MDNDRVLKNMMAYSEVWSILNLLEESYASRIPQQVKAFFERERLKGYEPQIDLDKPLTEQNLQRETMVLLAMLNVNYWCDSEEEREFWLREMAKNDNREYDPNDMFWDLRHIFDESEKIYDNNNEYPTKTEEENHVLIHLPNSELTIYVNHHDRKTIIPLKFFKSHEINNTSTDPALEIFLWDSWGPVLDVKNVGLDDIYLRQRITPKSTVLAVDGSKFIYKADDEAAFQINMIGKDTYIRNISNSAAEITRPLHKGEKISVDLELESALVNREGDIILSISTPDGWILEEWDPDNEW